MHSEALCAWSSGQKQRLHLSLALGTESPVVLLDEPASNLDATGIRWFHEVIADVAAASTLIVATNDRNKEARSTSTAGNLTRQCRWIKSSAVDWLKARRGNFNKPCQPS